MQAMAAIDPEIEPAAHAAALPGCRCCRSAMSTVGELDPTWAKRPHRRIEDMDLTAAPAQPQVLFDLEQCVLRYAEGARRGGAATGSFAAFRVLWQTLRMEEMFGMRKSCGRVHAQDETDEDWIAVLLRCAARHLQPAVHECVHERTGALFLVYALYTRQPWSGPPVCIPLAEEEWPAVDGLANELRASRQADGFAALHQLRCRRAFAPVKLHFHWVSDAQAAASARRSAAALAVAAGRADARASAALVFLDRARADLSKVERRYSDAWAAARAATGCGEAFRLGPGALLDALLGAREAGEQAAAAARREEALREVPSWGTEGHRSRERKRAQAYNPVRKRRAEETGGRAHAQPAEGGDGDEVVEAVT
jgi:hypothetical protein